MEVKDNAFQFVSERISDVIGVLQNIEDEEVGNFITDAVNRKTMIEIAHKYNEFEGRESDNRMNEIIKRYPLAENALLRLLYLINEDVAEYAISLICDIEEVIYDKAYDDGWDEAIREYEKGKPDLVVDTQKGYKDSSYYRPICKRGEEENLLRAGLCCGICSHYNGGYCCNPIYTQQKQPKVELFQICECVSLKKIYRAFYFDGKEYRQRGNKNRCYKHISDIVQEMIAKLEEKISTNEKFIEFIKTELPEPYKLLLKEYRKRGEKLYE